MVLDALDRPNALAAGSAGQLGDDRSRFGIGEAVLVVTDRLD